MSAAKIIFLTAKTSEEKFQKITGAAWSHFEKKEPFFILSPSDEVSEYLDKLLWKYPKNSFLPHVISSTPSHELVVISTKNENLNRSVAVLNLSPSPLIWKDLVKVIYELETPEKQVEVKQKFQVYRKELFSISSM